MAVIIVKADLLDQTIQSIYFSICFFGKGIPVIFFFFGRRCVCQVDQSVIARKFSINRRWWWCLPFEASNTRNLLWEYNKSWRKCNSFFIVILLIVQNFAIFDTMYWNRLGKKEYYTDFGVWRIKKKSLQSSANLIQTRFKENVKYMKFCSSNANWYKLYPELNVNHAPGQSSGHFLFNSMNILFVLYLWSLPVAFILPHRDFHELSRFPFGITSASLVTSHIKGGILIDDCRAWHRFLLSKRA